MAQLEKKKFSLDNELKMLKKMLCLPITGIVFDERYEYGKVYLDEEMNHEIAIAKLYVGDEMIGAMQYFTSTWGFGYLNRYREFTLDKVYLQFQHEIFNEILQQEPLAVTADVIKDEEALILSVKDKDGIAIKAAFCNYVDGEWRVNVSGLNYVSKVQTTTVRLTKPTLKLKAK